MKKQTTPTVTMCRSGLRKLGLDREGIVAALQAGRFDADRKFEIEVETLKRLVQESHDRANCSMK